MYIYHSGHNKLPLGGTLSFFETPERFCVLENISGASISIQMIMNKMIFSFQAKIGCLIIVL